MKNSALYYNVGPLLYCPANSKNIAASLIHEKFGVSYSLALCLEDTINDNYVEQAENTLIRSLRQLYETRQTLSFFLPKIFVRVRNAAQIAMLPERLGEAAELLCGFILPKFDLSNADLYIETAARVNANSGKKFYFMPILESPAIIDLKSRAFVLSELKERLATIEESVLNIRVGGNDLCHIFGFRRRSSETIHDIRPVANIFSDIITAFGSDYVVSGPVWEYYNQTGWDTGLRRELQLDRLCGFIGKTVIHPNQISLVNQEYAVDAEDLNDAKAILNWDLNAASFVSGNTAQRRMNEYKTHANWAEKIIFLSMAYGCKDAIHP